MNIEDRLRAEWKFWWTDYSAEWPLGTPRVVVASMVVYLTVIFGLQQLMRLRRSGFGLAYVTAAHNMILCLWSLIMTVAVSHEVYQVWKREGGGWKPVMCRAPGEPESATGQLQFWTWMYFLSKFYELLDTVILVLKKKQLIFLHVYHHTIVLPMSFLWLDAHMIFHAFGLVFNTSIHVIMYYYYGRSALGRKVIPAAEASIDRENPKRLVVKGTGKKYPHFEKVYASHHDGLQEDQQVIGYAVQTYAPFWKRYLTSMQITQFATSFVLTGIFLYYYFYDGPCSGGLALCFTMFCNSTFLVLFSNFYKKSYSSAQSAASKKSSRSSAIKTE